jgi:TrmH family RNA methyltransferase
MLSKARIKYIKSLQLKKHRDRDGLFLVEGEKSVLEFMNSLFKIQAIYGVASFIAGNKSVMEQKYIEFETISEDELISIGSYQSNKGALAVVQQRETTNPVLSQDKYTLALDTINDPGNLGTIIRLADWYGIEDILLSPGCVDVYNPKVVNSTKGSLARVTVHYGDLNELLSNFDGAIYAALLEGVSVHEATFAKGGIVLMGSESHGIGTDLVRLATEKITIPKTGRAESLNVALAAAIICDNIYRTR